MNSTKLISEAKTRSKTLEQERAEQKRLEQEDKLRDKEQARVKMALEATQLLYNINRDVFADMTVADWKGDDGVLAQDIYYQIPGLGRIYYFYVTPAWGERKGQLFYFKKYMGLGGSKFDTWDELAELLGKHMREIHEGLYNKTYYDWKENKKEE